MNHVVMKGRETAGTVFQKDGTVYANDTEYGHARQGSGDIRKARNMERTGQRVIFVYFTRKGRNVPYWSWLNTDHVPSMIYGIESDKKVIK